jgi:hypothetical protein
VRRILLALPVLALVLGLAGCRFTSDNGSTVDCPSLPTATVTAVATGTCTWTASPLPTTSTTPPTTTTTAPPATTTTTTVPPTTTTTTSSAPPPSGFPTPATTGAPANTALAIKTGTQTINTAGATITGWHVTGDLVINAPGVTIKNSIIDGQIENDSVPYGSARMLIQDTTVGTPAGCNDLLGVGEHDYTAIRVRITGRGDGFRVSGNNVTVQDSFVQACDSVENHDDGMQVYCPAPDLPQPCHNVTINHNTLSVANTRNFTAPLWGGLGAQNGTLADSVFTNNLLWGGVYSIYLGGNNLTITGNRVATNRWTMPNGEACEGNTTGVATPRGCSYAGWVYASSQVTCPTVKWSDNLAVTIDTNTWQPTNPGAALNCA